MSAKSGLGKGLSALIPSVNLKDLAGPGLFNCPVEKIRPNPKQPRKNMDATQIEALAASIKEKGILQPIVVREVEDGYEIVAGERRWRAAQLAGLFHVPVLIKDVSPSEAIELALIENLQRQELNPIEEGMAYQSLAQEYGLTQEQIAQKVSKDRSSVANAMRLLKLPDFIQQDVIDGVFSMGMARTLLSLTDPELQKYLRNEIIDQELTVRKAEALANRLKQDGIPKPAKPVQKQVDPDIKKLCEDLTIATGIQVAIKPTSKTQGRIELRYNNLDEFEAIVRLMRAEDSTPLG